MSTFLATNLYAIMFSFPFFQLHCKMRQVSWQKNWETCCSLGMMPLTLDSASHQECLSNITKSSNWTGNHNYWSSGTEQGCRGNWSWCVIGAAPKAISNDVKWEAGQPDNRGGRQDCVHIKNVNKSGLFLTD
jgi:hypothetical protein